MSNELRDGLNKLIDDEQARLKLTDDELDKLGDELSKHSRNDNTLNYTIVAMWTVVITVIVLYIFLL